MDDMFCGNAVPVATSQKEEIMTRTLDGGFIIACLMILALYSVAHHAITVWGTRSAVSIQSVSVSVPAAKDVKPVLQALLPPLEMRGSK